MQRDIPLKSFERVCSLLSLNFQKKEHLKNAYGRRSWTQLKLWLRIWKKNDEVCSPLESRVPLLEPAHGVEDAELLSALPEVDDARGEVVLVA